jgi:hypothetical protein
MTSQGTFANVVCGTGEAGDTSNTIRAVSSFPATPPLDAWVVAQGPNLDYDLLFVDFHGWLLFRPDPLNPVPDPGNAQGGGSIVIIDPTPGNTGPADPHPAGPNDCTGDFEVVGSVAGYLP